MAVGPGSSNRLVRPAEAHVADGDDLVVPHRWVLDLEVQDEAAHLVGQCARFTLEQGAHASVLERREPVTEGRLRGAGLVRPLGHGATEGHRRTDPLVLDLIGHLQEKLQFRPLLGGPDPPSPRHQHSPSARRHLERPPAQRGSPSERRDDTYRSPEACHAPTPEPAFLPRRAKECVTLRWRGLVRHRAYCYAGHGTLVRRPFRAGPTPSARDLRGRARWP